MPDCEFTSPLAALPPDAVLPEICVKNTFICCDDMPPELDMRRCVTDSAEMSVGGPLDPSCYPPPEAQATITEEDEKDGDSGISGPPTPIAMYRGITSENFESKYEWSWAYEQDAGQTAEPPVPEPPMPQQPQQSMMPMRQAQAMPMVAMMPAGAPNQTQPQLAIGPDGQLMQIMPMVPMRGIRWPDEAQGSAQQRAPGGPPDAGNPPPRTVVPPPQASGLDRQGSNSVARKEPPKYSTPAADEPPALQTLTRAFSVGSGAFRVNWTLSAVKLRSADKNAVSPAFELSFGGAYSSTKFKLMLFPQVCTEGKGGSTFRKSKGKGFLLLKCEAEIQEVAGFLKFRLFVGNQAPRGPVTHDFSHSAVKGLPKELETWELEESVTNGHFVVGAEIIPCGV